MATRFIVCSFSTTDIKGRRLRGAARDSAYAALKNAVLAAGMFSVFEATQSPRAADLFTQLDSDPELEVFQMAFPWTGVRLRQVDGHCKVEP